MEMNTTQRVMYLALLFSLVSWNVGLSQHLFNLKAGIESWSIKDEIDLSGQSHHSGQTIGFDLHLQDNRFIFAPGFHYHRISVLNQKGGYQLKFGDGNHIHYFSIPLTVGYKVFHFDFMDVAGMLGEETIFFYDLDHNDLGLTSDQFYGVIPALTAVVHTEFWSLITLELKYRYALTEMIKERPDSKLKGFALELGAKF
jgi:hypothetical protein